MWLCGSGPASQVLRREVNRRRRGPGLREVALPRRPDHGLLARQRSAACLFLVFWRGAAGCF